MNKEIELLAPVGSMEALGAAVMNGADAVYLGGKLFNARQYASNFSNEELIEAVSYAHLREVRVYVTVNILLDDTEVGEALDYTRFLHEIGVDAVIVQDIGFAAIVREILPGLELHASTQMAINNLQGAKHLEKLGFKRAVLAREVDAEEIKYIAQNSKLELEVFVHGALCYSYSGQCLMSSLIGGRSGNRGTCAQPCRMAYTIVDEKNSKLSNWDKSHFLSTRDLNTLEQVENLISLGIKSFKIEGRMKRAEYVATVTGLYRKAIDSGSIAITADDNEDIIQIFNREFTKGMTFGDFGKSFVSIERPDNRGLRIGTVEESGRKGTSILFYKRVAKGDGLEWISVGGETDGLKSPREIEAGERLLLQRVFDAKSGSIVNRTSSTELFEKEKRTYENVDKKNPVQFLVTIKIESEPILNAECMGIKVEVVGENKVQNALNAALTKAKVEEQLSKLGDTIFFMDHIEINLDDNAFLPAKDLNELRRRAVVELEARLLKRWCKSDSEVPDFVIKKSKALSLIKSSIPATKLSIKVSTQDQLDQLDLGKVHRIYLGFYTSLEENLIKLKKFVPEVYLWTDKILYERDFKRLGALIENNYSWIDGISASNLGTVEYFTGYGKKIHGDIGLNAFNSYSCSYLEKLGIESITLSPELNLRQMGSLTRKLGGKKEAVVYGFLPSMIARNCPMAIVKGCKDDKSCKNCRYAHGFKLEDRLGKLFPMERGDGFSTIYNSVPIMVPDSIKAIEEKGISMLRLDFTIEDKVHEIQRIYYDFLTNLIDRDTVEQFMNDYKKNNEITNGHFFRGVVER